METQPTSSTGSSPSFWPANANSTTAGVPTGPAAAGTGDAAAATTVVGVADGVVTAVTFGDAFTVVAVAEAAAAAAAAGDEECPTAGSAPCS